MTAYIVNVAYFSLARASVVMTYGRWADRVHRGGLIPPDSARRCLLFGNHLGPLSFDCDKIHPLQNVENLLKVEP
jgi:hypothetical protein